MFLEDYRLCSGYNLLPNSGNDRLKEYNVRMLTMVPGQLERFPDILYVCAAVSPSKFLRAMADLLEIPWQNNELDVHIQQKTISVSAGNVLHLRWTCSDEVQGTTGVEPGINHRGRLIWPHVDVLRKAANLESVFALCYISQRDEMIMTRVNLDDLGSLKFIMIPHDAAGPADATAEADAPAEADAAALAEADAPVFRATIMEGPSNPNPEKLFQFTITPLTQIEQAFDALSDRDFNPIGLGVLKLTGKAVEFIAGNDDTNVTGYLRLNSTALKDVYFNSRCKGRFFRIQFSTIFENITNADNTNEESITFSYFNGSDNIIVNLGNDPAKVFNLPLFTMISGFKRVPAVQCVCAATIPSDWLREMLDRLITIDYNALVNVDIAMKKQSVRIGIGTLWELDHDMSEVLTDQHHHQAWFHWFYMEALTKASCIAPKVQLCILTQPKDTIMTEFPLQELGDLVFLHSAISVILNSKLEPAD